MIVIHQDALGSGNSSDGHKYQLDLKETIHHSLLKAKAVTTYHFPLKISQNISLSLVAQGNKMSG